VAPTDPTDPTDPTVGLIVGRGRGPLRSPPCSFRSRS